MEVTAEDFIDADMKRTFEFVETHARDHGSLPSAELVNKICEVSLYDQDAAPGFLVTEFLKRRLFRRTDSVTKAARGKLKENDPEAAFKMLREFADTTDSALRDVKPRSVFKAGKQALELYDKVADGYTGVPLPWDSLTNASLGMWPKTSTWFAARPGVGKCVRGDTLVMDANSGVYRKISEIVSSQSDVLTRREDGTIARVTPAAWLHTGRKECIRIVLRSGRELSGTPEHPVMTVDGWKRLDEISPGDHVETVRKVPEPKGRITPPDHEVFMIAALLAEGGYTSDQVTFTNEDPEIVSTVCESAELLGAEMVQHRGARSFEYAFRWGDGQMGMAGENPVRFLLNTYGCGHEKAVDKKIPDRVFQYSNKALAKFLGMFWSCDGSVLCGGTVEIGLASKVMVEQIQRLLLRFGITSRVRYKEVHLNEKKFDSWVLRVHSTANGLFRDRILMIGQKARVASELKDGANPNVDLVPMTQDLRGKILDAVERGRSQGARFTDLAMRLGMNSCMSRDKLVRRKSISRRLLSAFIETFGAHELRQYLVNHWDRVESVRDDGVQEVYDLSIDSTHAFVAEDIVVHNTWVVWLISRGAWLKNYRVLVISPEMSVEEGAERFFILDSGVSGKDVLRGTLPSMQYAKFKKAVEEGEDNEGLWIIDSDDDLSPSGMEAAIRACRPQLVAIDAAYLLNMGGKDRTENIIRAVNWVRTMAKRYGAKFDTAFVAFHQLSRAATKPSKSGGVGYQDGAIALTDQLFWDAHAVWIMEQNRDMKEDLLLNFHCSKIRRGTWLSKPVEVQWDFDRMKFAETEPPQGTTFNDDEYDEPDDEILF